MFKPNNNPHTCCFALSQENTRVKAMLSFFFDQGIEHYEFTLEG
jgi:hypothetical protein